MGSPRRRKQIENILHNQHVIRRAMFPKTDPARRASLLDFFRGANDGPDGSGRSAEIAPSHLWVLVAVIRFQDETDGGPTVKQVAEHLMMTSSAVTQAVDTLAAKGLLIRSDDPRDRRASLITLSPLTASRVDALKHYFSEKYRPLFDVLTAVELAEYERLTAKLASTARQLQQVLHDPGK